MSQLNKKMDFDELLTPYVQGNLDEEQRKYVEERAKLIVNVMKNYNLNSKL